MLSPRLLLLMVIAFGLVATEGVGPVVQDAEPEVTASAPVTEFVYPCAGYTKGLRGKGNFGLYVDPRRGASAFAGSYHLAEDVWVAGGTRVDSVADGRVVYSDFSPTWTDDEGHVHWNLGNVIVIEHALPPVNDEPQWLCSVYVHLAADRRVEVGDLVRRGQQIGLVGKHQSEENGRYPAHLHFGLHRGPYVQISPGWRRDLERDAREFGLPCGPDRELVRGEIELTLLADRSGLPGTTVQVDFVEEDAKMYLSLLVGSTSPGYQPADIMGWCEGYGDKQTVEEWVKPSTWIRKHAPAR